jgi:hypothetical protein
MERNPKGATNRVARTVGRGYGSCACGWVCSMERQNTPCIVQMVTEACGSVRDWRRNAVQLMSGAAAESPWLDEGVVPMESGELLSGCR